MKKEKRREAIKEATNNLLDMFRNGDLPESIALSIIQRREGDWQPSHAWSLGNRLLMLAQGTTDARGYRQWQQVGRQVKKGRKAFYILGPLTKKITEVDEDTGEEVEKVMVYGFTPIPVFRYEDTEGKPLEKPDYTPYKLPPLYDVTTKLGIDVEYKPGTQGYFGAFIPSKNKLVLHSYDEVVFYHELSHAIHHQFRDVTKMPEVEREIVAETAGLVLCHLKGVKGYEAQGYKYIQRYADRKEQDMLKLMMRVLGDVEAVVTRILEVAEDDVSVLPDAAPEAYQGESNTIMQKCDTSKIGPGDNVMLKEQKRSF